MRCANIRYVDYGGGGAHSGLEMGVARSVIGEKTCPRMHGVRTLIAYSSSRKACLSCLGHQNILLVATCVHEEEYIT